jgi:hypothetical protein
MITKFPGLFPISLGFLLVWTHGQFTFFSLDDLQTPANATLLHELTIYHFRYSSCVAAAFFLYAVERVSPSLGRPTSHVLSRAV